MSYSFLIELEHVEDPKVWRRVILPGSCSFSTLHEVIQYSFGWENEHLYDFENAGPKSLSSYKKPIFIEPAEFSGAPAMGGIFSFVGDKKKKSIDSGTAILSNYFKKPGDYMIYTYDFGDNWEHKVTFEGEVEEEDNGEFDIKCIDGAGMCPPEDCGGLPGWMELKSAVRNPSPTKGQKELIEWCFGFKKVPKRFSLETFDKKAANEILSQIAEDEAENALFDEEFDDYDEDEEFDDSVLQHSQGLSGKASGIDRSGESVPNFPYIAPKKPGRNEPCPCGSGKKYKNCCGKYEN